MSDFIHSIQSKLEPAQARTRLGHGAALAARMRCLPPAALELLRRTALSLASTPGGLRCVADALPGLEGLAGKPDTASPAFSRYCQSQA